MNGRIVAGRFRRRGRGWLAVLLGLGLTTGVACGRAVILFGTGDPEAHTLPPEGDLSGSGWQFQGRWGKFLGTVVGPRHFITAKHVPPVVEAGFRYRGEEYAIRAYYDYGEADLRIWELCRELPAPYAPLYRSDDETGKRLVVFGRGTTRGPAIWLPTDQGSEFRGWRHGYSDFRCRWGENVVTAIIGHEELHGPEADPGSDVQYLVVDFDRGGGFNEAHLSSGDSGGAVFIRDQGRWALAGINQSIDGPFNTLPFGNGFHACLFDARGFYLEQNLSRDWVLIADEPDPLPSAFYAIRISPLAEWIDRVTAGDLEPDLAAPFVISASEVEGPYRWEFEQQIETPGQTVSLALAGDRRFYYLLGCGAYRIDQIATQEGNLILNYRLEP